eukprot:scaffold134321_cov18-Prasinocladus_malaysianus.AAC.2
MPMNSAAGSLQTTSSPPWSSLPDESYLGCRPTPRKEAEGSIITCPNTASFYYLLSQYRSNYE